MKLIVIFHKLLIPPLLPGSLINQCYHNELKKGKRYMDGNSFEVLKDNNILEQKIIPDHRKNVFINSNKILSHRTNDKYKNHTLSRYVCLIHQRNYPSYNDKHFLALT